MNLSGVREKAVGRFFWLLPYAIGVLNLLLFHVLFRIERGTFFGGDSGEFLRIAEALRSGALFATPDNAKPLGYPMVLALAASLPGDTVANALLFNACFYLVTLAMVGRMARLLNCSPRGAVMAQIVFALVPNTAAWANLVYSDTLTMALFVSSVWAFLKIASASERAIRLGPVMRLGVLLGALSVTRTEYVLLLPMATLLLCRRWLVRRAPVRHAVGSVSLFWVCALPLLMVQPTVSGWRGLASFIPPNQSGPLQLWAGRFDLDFSELRIFKLVDLVRLVSGSPQTDLQDIRQQLDALKSTETGEDPIDDRVLDLAFRDLQILRALAAQGVTPLDAYRQLAWTTFAQDPWRVVARAGRRFVLYLTAAEGEWPGTHPAHWLYTVVLRPLSGVGYLCLVVLIAVARGQGRRLLVASGLWMVFPILVHSWFMFEQRWALPSVPLLCVVCARGGQALSTWHARRTTSVALVCGR